MSRSHARIRLSAKFVCSLIVLGVLRVAGAGGDATFVIDEQQSSLSIDASTRFIFPLSDSDTQQLTGTINTTLDFGTSGLFAAMADITVNSANISALDPFSLRLGFPPLGVNISFTDAVANVTTPNPPATLTQLPTGLLRYQFDAAEFDVTLVQGIVAVSGAVNETFDLSAEPVTGAAEPGTFGTLTVVNIISSGALSQVDAVLDLPIQFTEVIDVDGQVVTLQVDGQIVANSNFDVVVSPPGDFDLDGDVDSDDLAKWQGDYGANGNSDADDDGDSDGADLLAWQRQFGGNNDSAIANVPEPRSLLLILISLASMNLSRRHR